MTPGQRGIAFFEAMYRRLLWMLPRDFRSAFGRDISESYHDLCRAMNAVIAFGFVAQAYEYERDHWSGNLDEPWSLLARRTREAIDRHQRSGGTVRTLARPHPW